MYGPCRIAERRGSLSFPASVRRDTTKAVEYDIERSEILMVDTLSHTPRMALHAWQC